MRARWWFLISGGVVAGVGAGGAWAAYEYVSIPKPGEASPSGVVLATRTPELKLAVTNPDRVKNIHATLDGQDISGSVVRGPQGFLIPVQAAQDGRHVVTFKAEGDTVFGGAVSHQWAIDVDTTAPVVDVTSPPRKTWTTSPEIGGTAEPGSIVSVAWTGGSQDLKAGADGTWKATLPVADGKTELRVTATDGAGNTTTRRYTLRLDAKKPDLKPTFATWLTTPGKQALAFTVADTSALTVTATLDGAKVAAKVKDGTLALPPVELAEGTHPLAVTVTDAAGNARTYKKVLGVDTSDDIEKVPSLQLGARGKDVKSLARRLRSEGLLDVKKLPTRFDGRMEKAVRTLEKRLGQPVDGIANRTLIDFMKGKLVASKSSFTVTLWLDGKAVARYPIAIGQPAFPTPEGSFEITNMQMNPTWFPPDSPWAQGLEPIPPGVSNPLGTRWIGTSAPAIGFHGTPQPWTVGTAASHGCMRMEIPDVEALYAQVWVGMRVEIQA